MAPLVTTNGELMSPPSASKASAVGSGANVTVVSEKEEVWPSEALKRNVYAPRTDTVIRVSVRSVAEKEAGAGPAIWDQLNESASPLGSVAVACNVTTLVGKPMVWLGPVVTMGARLVLDCPDSKAPMSGAEPE